MKMKKLGALLLSAAMVMSLAACGGSKTSSAPAEEPKAEEAAPAEEAPAAEEEAPAEEAAPAEEGSNDLSGVTLEIAVTYAGDQQDVFQGLVDEFCAETGAVVNVDYYGDDYESTLKTRMASNELPDIWQTHGWSLLRYKEYLMPLNDQPWIADLDESAFGVIQEDDGSVYVLMISELVNAVLVNVDVCEAAGVDYLNIDTWDQMTEACQKVKDAGYTPFGTTSNAGQTANFAGTFVSYEGEYAEDSAAMLDGSWDWQSYRDSFMNLYADWINRGFFYDDILTMSNDDFTERWANGKSAFITGNDPSVNINAKNLNPDANYAFIPDPASKEGGAEFIGIGEGDTFGIWKDSANADAAKVFLNYMARPEVALKMNEATGKISCLRSTMAIDTSYGLSQLTDLQEKFASKKLFYENLWDRKYMPSGMWGIFGNACNMIFEDHSEAGLDAARDYLLENYQDLYEDAHS